MLKGKNMEPFVTVRVNLSFIVDVAMDQSDEDFKNWKEIVANLVYDRIEQTDGIEDRDIDSVEILKMRRDYR